MKKKFVRVSEINARIRAIADSMETENRSMTEAEEAEVQTLKREKSFLTMQLEAAANPGMPETVASMRDSFRAMKAKTTLQLREAGATDTMLTADVKTGGLVPVTTGDIVKPLRANTVYNAIGIQIPTGCRGEYEWPVVEAVKATIAGEAVKVGAKKIDLAKVPVTKQRIAVVIEASRESLFDSDGKLEAIVREQLPLAIADTLDQVILSPEKVTADCVLSGPFTGKTPVAVDATFKALNKEKAKLLAKGLTGSRMAWVMTEATKAELESTPKDAGSGIMVIEDGRMCGLPVYTSDYIGEGNIGLGDFTYQVCGQFGDFNLLFDPYTGADAATVRFVLNADFGTATLRPEAFALLKLKA